jgi:V/A-type H+-transporting ATPase subunit I
MAIAKMVKIIIVSHRSQASELLEALQREGICHILNAEQAIVSRDFPDISASAERPKDTEGLLSRLQKSIAFLQKYSQKQKGLAGVLAPRAVIDEQSYNKVVSDRKILTTIDKCEQLEASMDKTRGEIDNLQNTLEMLRPWSSFQTPVEEIGQLSQAACWAGLIPNQQYEHIEEKLGELGAAIQKIGQDGNRSACLIACLKESADEVQKALRSSEFEPVNFEPMTGTASELIGEHSEKLDQARSKLQTLTEEAIALSENLLNLQILYDHNQNLLNREQTRGTAPATESTVLLEGWIKKRDFPLLEKLLSGFDASSLTEIEPAEGEEIPVEIENEHIIRPFEMITRLYGMPHYLNVDPTIFLAPFFGMFFGICLGDAGYGLVVILAAAWFARKLQGDKKLVLVLGLCSIFAVIFGALTGSWFGDAIGNFLPALEPFRKKLMWFDPFEKPMMLLGLSVALGYIQIMTGLLIALAHNLKRKDFIAALCDQCTWLVMLNCIVLFGMGKAGVVPPNVGRICGWIVPIPAATIFLLSSREGGWGARLGMGAYNLFSTIFFLGDVLSYLRLMGLCMVGAGLGMAMNLMAKMAMDIPFIGIVIAIIVFIIGHGFNLVLAVLGAFVHTMRLQFVEFFPKFLVSGGKTFEPLNKEYKHIYIK